MHEEELPRAGYRARLWRRFERDLTAWLETPQGQFALYCAERERLDSALRAREDNLSEFVPASR